MELTNLEKQYMYLIIGIFVLLIAGVMYLIYKRTQNNKIVYGDTEIFVNGIDEMNKKIEEHKSIINLNLDIFISQLYMYLKDKKYVFKSSYNAEPNSLVHFIDKGNVSLYIIDDNGITDLFMYIKKYNDGTKIHLSKENVNVVIPVFYNNVIKKLIGGLNG